MARERLRLAYAGVVAVLGLGAALAITWQDPWHGHPLWLLLAFLVGTLVALEFGFQLASYSSLDRIPQVAAILVLGPVDAVWINILASLLFPFLNHGYGQRRPGFALARALHNAGMLSLMIVGGALAYGAAGGGIPLRTLSPADAWAVVVLIVTMQAINAALVAARTWVERGDRREAALSSSDLLDVAVAPVGVLSAILLNRLEPTIVLLYVGFVLILVLVVNRLARSRQELQQRYRELEAAAHRDRELLELQRRTLELQRQSAEDSLTGLSNRRHLDQRLASEIELAELREQPFCLALADLDEFKRANDAHGHAIGDEVLRVAATLLRRHCRGIDLVARYGGEEFALVLPETGLDGARGVCERIRAAFETYDWTSIAPGLAVTLSVGVAEWRAGMDAATLFARADESLYSAKRGGRNRVAYLVVQPGG